MPLLQLQAMKRFNFALDKVLELRLFREDEARIELGRAIAVLMEIEGKIKLNALAKANAMQERFSDVKGGSQAMLAWDNYIARLEQETERLLKEAAQAELLVEEKREIYLEASREKEVMEKLKEKKEEEYRKETFAAESRELDDRSRVLMY
jgi:flagellar FliJ protein